MSDDRVKVSLEDALARLDILPDYDPGDGPKPCVHTFIPSGPVLLGAHWPLADVKDAMETFGVEESGPEATAMHHSLVILRGKGPVFLATKESPDAP